MRQVIPAGDYVPDSHRKPARLDAPTKHKALAEGANDFLNFRWMPRKWSTGSRIIWRLGVCINRFGCTMDLRASPVAHQSR